MNCEFLIGPDFAETDFPVQAVVSIENLSDNELIKQILDKNERAFFIVFERHKRAVALHAGKFFSRPEQVEEIIQISFTAAYLSLQNFRGLHEKSFISWLLQITNNACLDQLRRQTRKREDLLCELTQAENAFLHENLSAENYSNAETEVVAKDLAHKLLAHLEPEDQMVLRLLDGAEMKVGEISALTGWSQSKVKVKAHRARKTLRKILHKFL